MYNTYMETARKMYVISNVYNDGDGDRTFPKFVTTNKQEAEDFVGYRNMENMQNYHYYLNLSLARIDAMPPAERLTDKTTDPNWDKAVDYSRTFYTIAEVTHL